MSTTSYKLVASIPALNLFHTFSLEKGRRYLLGSAAMEPGMLVFAEDRSISRRQAWLEVIDETLSVERHPQASQRLNANDSIKTLRLEAGQSFTAGRTVFRFLAVSGDSSPGAHEKAMEQAPQLTYTLSARDFSSLLPEAGGRSFLEVVAEMPSLMRNNNTPAEFLLALCRTLRERVHNLQITAWQIQQCEQQYEFLPLQTAAADPAPLVPSRHLVTQAFAASGDDSIVSVWQRSTAPEKGAPSLLGAEVEWAMCVPIALSRREQFALYATGQHSLAPAGQPEVQQILAALGALAKQHLLAARVKERRGQIGQFFSPALRSILLSDSINLEEALKPGEYEATICFFDLRGSSRMAENLHAGGGRRPVAEYFERLENILGEATQAIFQTEGMVIDFQGDAIFGCWGVPERKTLPAAQAVVAAMRIVQLMQELDWPEGDANLRCGLGITSGKVLAGLFSARSGEQGLLSKYTVMGPAVNQASRLEGMTKKFGVPILLDGGVAAALAHENIALRRIAAVRPAGMRQPVQVYELVLPPALGGTGVTAEGTRAYETALALFEKGEFAAAAEALNAAPRDRIALFLSEEIARRLTHGPPPDWDGVIELAAK